MDSTEDFSFPRISDTYPYTFDSPPLWNPSPATSSPSNPYQVFREERRERKGCENGCFEAKLITQSQRKSFLYDKEEEKMDLLWEDFNEELFSSTTGSATSSSREQMVELKRGSTALTVAKNNGALVPTKNYNKPGMVVVMKVLKKLFSLTNSQGKPTRRRRKVC